MERNRFARGAPARLLGLPAAVLGLCLLLAGPAAARTDQGNGGRNPGLPVAGQAATFLARGEGFDRPDGSERVRALQRRLLQAGQDPGPVDGLFGPLTEAAVVRLQQQRGFGPDGIVGDRTSAALGGGLTGSRGSGAGVERPGGSQERPPQPGVARPGTQAPTGGPAERGTNEPKGRNARPERPKAQTDRDRPRGQRPGAGGGGAPGGAPSAPGGEGEGIPGALLLVVVVLLLLGFTLVVAYRSGALSLEGLRREWRSRRPAILAPSAPSRPAPVEARPREEPPSPPAAEPVGAEAATTVSASKRVLGYARVSRSQDRANGAALRTEAAAIEAACDRRGWILLELVHDLEPENGQSQRPGLAYALERIAVGEASGLVVGQLSGVTRSVVELGTLLEWFGGTDAALVALDLDLDTSTPDGQRTATALQSVSQWERERVAARTREGLAAAQRESTSRPAVRDRPALRERIVTMRKEGMTLQAIADTLNDEGVPTLRGGAKWRPSSVQAAVGYKRRTARMRPTTLPLPPSTSGRSKLPSGVVPPSRAARPREEDQAVDRPRRRSP